MGQKQSFLIIHLLWNQDKEQKIRVGFNFKQECTKFKYLTWRYLKKYKIGLPHTVDFKQELPLNLSQVQKAITYKIQARGLSPS